VITTSIDTTGYDEVSSEALRAHATQVVPNHPLWFGLPPEVRNAIQPADLYRLALSRVGEPRGLERDLFEGILPFSPLERAPAAAGTQSR